MANGDFLSALVGALSGAQNQIGLDPQLLLDTQLAKLGSVGTGTITPTVAQPTQQSGGNLLKVLATSLNNALSNPSLISALGGIGATSSNPSVAGLGQQVQQRAQGELLLRMLSGNSSPFGSDPSSLIGLTPEQVLGGAQELRERRSAEFDNFYRQALTAKTLAPERRDTQVVTVDDREVLIDKQTGEEIRTLGQAPGNFSTFVGGDGLLYVFDTDAGVPYKTNIKGESDVSLQTVLDPQTGDNRLAVVDNKTGEIVEYGPQTDLREISVSEINEIDRYLSLSFFGKAREAILTAGGDNAAVIAQLNALKDPLTGQINTDAIRTVLSETDRQEFESVRAEALNLYRQGFSIGQIQETLGKVFFPEDDPNIVSKTSLGGDAVYDVYGVVRPNSTFVTVVEYQGKLLYQYDAGDETYLSIIPPDELTNQTGNKLVDRVTGLNQRNEELQNLIDRRKELDTLLGGNSDAIIKGWQKAIARNNAEIKKLKGKGK